MKKLLRPYVRHKRVVLKGGQSSGFYIDIKAAMGEPKIFARLIHELAAMVPNHATCIAGSGYGGLPLAAAVAHRLMLPFVMVRDTAKQHGTKQLVDGYVPNSKDRVVIIDDVYTSGTSIRHTERVLRRRKVPVIGRCVVVDRSVGNPPVISLVRGEDLLQREQ